MKIPKRYEDLTVEQFQQLEQLKTDNELDSIDKAIKRLSILSGKTIDEVEDMTATDIHNHLLDAIFLSKPLHEIETPKEIKLGGVKFRYIEEISQYNICQEKDWKEMVKATGNYIDCLPELMAICHQEFENDKWVYNSDNHLRNVELFKKSKLSESLGAVFFYSKSLTNYTKILADFSEKVNNEIHQQVNEMMADQEFKTFLNDGDGNTQ
jgi:hypothetical protein